MPGLVEKPAKPRSEVAELWEAVAKDKANDAVMSSLQKEVLAVKEAVADLLRVMEKSRSLRAEVEKKDRSSEMGFSMTKHREKAFNETMTAVNKKISAAIVEYAALRWNQHDVLPKLKVWETNLGESLKARSKRTAECSSMISKQLVTEVAHGFERIFAEFKCDAA